MKLQKDLAAATWHWQDVLAKHREDLFVQVSFCQAAFLGKMLKETKESSLGYAKWYG